MEKSKREQDLKFERAMLKSTRKIVADLKKDKSVSKEYLAKLEKALQRQIKKVDKLKNL